MDGQTIGQVTGEFVDGQTIGQLAGASCSFMHAYALSLLQRRCRCIIVVGGRYLMRSTLFFKQGLLLLMVTMGQVIRAARYDRAANESNAISKLAHVLNSSTRILLS